jgi:hypothetical protein
MVQKTIRINDVNLPILEEGGVNYYPISYIGSKVLLKNISPSQLKSNGYDKYIKEFNIDYGENTGGSQLTYCISEEGLKQTLSNCKIARLSVEQKKAMQNVCKYLNIKINVDIEEKFIDSLPEEIWQKYDFWTKECIESILNIEPNIKWQRCSKCGKYYPYVENFFHKEGNPNNKEPLRSICKLCKKWTDNRGRLYIQNINKEYQCIFLKYGKDIYLLFKNKNVIDIWEWYDKSDYKKIPEIFKEKDNILNLLYYLYKNNKIIDNNINTKDIVRILGFDVFYYSSITISDVYKKLIGIDLINKKGFGIENFEDAKTVLLNYIQKNNIEITYDYDLWGLIKNVGLTTYLMKIHNNDILDFILKVFEYKFISYKFKGGYKKHWINEANRNIALKQLIEVDMKIPIDKIPLYLTLENLRKQSNTMRNILKKYYNNNIWLWINEIYPNYFNEEDFNVTVIRHVFDSAEESLIHDILISKFKNVLYNQRNIKNTISILGMQPDWFIFTNNGVWIIEYFGISVEHNTYNKRTEDYKKKTISKIDKYKTLNWLRTVYIYPEDLKNNFKGLEDKLNVIV